MKQNEGSLDRVVRIVLGILLLLVSTYYLSGVIQVIAAILGLISLFTGLTGFCGLYSLLGISTLEKSRKKASSKK